MFLVDIGGNTIEKKRRGSFTSHRDNHCSHMGAFCSSLLFFTIKLKVAEVTNIVFVLIYILQLLFSR